MEDPTDYNEREAISIRQLQEVTCALCTSLSRANTKTFTLERVLVPFLGEPEGSKDAIVGVVDAGENELGNICDDDVGQEALDSSGGDAPFYD